MAIVGRAYAGAPARRKAKALGKDMKFSLPGQLKGPECRRVMSQAVALRRQLEPVVAEIPNDRVKELAIVLRIDGSLGSFGPETIENIELSGSTLSCDVVIRDFGWENIEEAEIAKLLKTRVHKAIVACFSCMNLETELSLVDGALKEIT